MDFSVVKLLSLKQQFNKPLPNRKETEQQTESPMTVRRGAFKVLLKKKNILLQQNHAVTGIDLPRLMFDWTLFESLTQISLKSVILTLTP